MLRFMRPVLTRPRYPRQLTPRPSSGNSFGYRAFNSAGEWHLHTVQVVGSIPKTPTNQGSAAPTLEHVDRYQRVTSLTDYLLIATAELRVEHDRARAHRRRPEVAMMKRAVRTGRPRTRRAGAAR